MTRSDSKSRKRWTNAYAAESGAARPVQLLSTMLAKLRAIRVAGESGGRQRVEQQLPPAIEELGARIHLDREHVARGESIARHQPLANLPRTRADLVAAVAELREHVAADHARVCRPDASAGRIENARVFGAIEPSLPAARSVGPRRGQHAIEARASRNRAVDGPADAAAAVGDDEVLPGRAETVRLVKRFLDRPG